MMDEETSAYKLVRSNDPDTSHDAADSIDPNRLEMLVLDTIAGFGATGCISDQVRECLPDLSYSSVTARFKALKEKQLMITDHRVRPGQSGRRQHVRWAAHYYTPDPDANLVPAIPKLPTNAGAKQMTFSEIAMEEIHGGLSYDH